MHSLSADASGGWYWGHERGISLGCPLSPLIGAFFLDELDRRMTATGLRFMDDILVLAPTRWKLRRAVIQHLGWGIFRAPDCVTTFIVTPAHGSALRVARG